MSEQQSGYGDHAPAPVPTPGPWQVSAGGGSNYREVYGDDGRKVVATLIYNSADARLIAAAPDLVYACQRYMAWLHAPATNRPEHGSDILDDMQAAIEKATGEQTHGAP